MNASMTLADSIARTLADGGVKRIFGIPGGGSSLDIIDAAARVDIEFILCRTETAAARRVAASEDQPRPRGGAS